MEQHGRPRMAPGVEKDKNATPNEGALAGMVKGLLRFVFPGRDGA